MNLFDATVATAPVSIHTQASGKLCSRCGGPGPFHKNKSNPAGLQRQCVACCKQVLAEYYKNNKQKVLVRCASYKSRNPEKYKEYDRKSKSARPEFYMWLKARNRAKHRGLDFNIEVSDITIPKRCPLLGVTLKVSKGSVGRTSPTLDRKNPSLGYVKGNVWVISHKANAMKQDASLGELELLVNNLRKMLSKGGA